MIFELIRVSTIYITIAYFGPCADIRGFDLPYSVDSRYRATDTPFYCKIDYQANVPEFLENFDGYVQQERLRQYITKRLVIKPRMDLYNVRRWYTGRLEDLISYE